MNNRRVPTHGYVDPFGGEIAAAQGRPASVSWEAFAQLMAEYLDSEGKHPDRELLEQVCLDWLEYRVGGVEVS